MANRIPPALNWLIDKRARLSFEMNKIEDSMARAERLLHELQDVKAKLAAVDTVLDLHNIKIDVALIEPVRTHKVRLNLPYGALTKSILTCLRLLGKNGPVSKTVILDFIIKRHYDYDMEAIDYQTVSVSLQQRLKNLQREGVIIRHHALSGSAPGLWSLAEPDRD